MSKQYRTDTSTNETKFKKPTTTPLVENFFGNLFDKSTISEHDSNKPTTKTNKPDEKMENEKHRKTSGHKAKTGDTADENSKPNSRKRRSSVNTSTEELSDTEEVRPLPVSKLPLKKRNLVSKLPPKKRDFWQQSEQRNLSEKNTMVEKSSDDDTGFKECEEKAKTKQTTEDEDTATSDISFLFERISEEIKRKSDFYAKLKENAGRNDQMKKQLKRALTAELKKLKDQSVEKSITFPDSPVDEQNNNKYYGKYVASSLTLRSSRTPTPQFQPSGLLRRSTQISTAGSKYVEKPLTMNSPTVTSSSGKQSRTEKSKVSVLSTATTDENNAENEKSGSILMVDLASSPNIEIIDIQENPTESPQMQSKRTSKLERKSRPSVTENLTTSSTIKGNYGIDEDSMESLQISVHSEKRNKSKRTSNQNVESVAVNSNLGIENIPMLEESISQAVKRRSRGKSKMFVSSLENSFDTDRETISPAKTSEKPRRSRRSTRKSINIDWQEYDMSSKEDEDQSEEEEKPSRKSRRKTRKSGAQSSKKNTDSDWTPEIVTPTSEDATRGRKRGRPWASRPSVKTAKSSVEGPPRKRSKLSTAESSGSWFPKAISKEENVQVGDFVSVSRDQRIGLIRKIWTDDDEKMNYHLQWFIPCDDTVLGDLGERKEIFQIDECDDVERAEIDGVYDVTRLSLKARHEVENSEFENWNEQAKKKTNALFYQKRYEPKFGRFRDIVDIKSDDEIEACPNCLRKKEEEMYERPIPVGPVLMDNTKQFVVSAVHWRGEEFRIGSSVFLPPGMLELQHWSPKKTIEAPYNEAEYPEKYRKSYTRDEDPSLSQPFDIGFISRIRSDTKNFTNARDVQLSIRKYYRPHNTHLPMEEADKKDLNLLYWSTDVCAVTLEAVLGKCYVAYENKLEIDASVWSAKGPYRFYFRKKYDKTLKKFVPLSKQDLERIKHSYSDTPVEWPGIVRPLSMMDVFSGCGGLSNGLQQSGVAECCWAIEIDEQAATAFQENNKHTIMYINSCEKQLEDFRNSTPQQRRYPQKGEVELLCGGPPCSGLSYLTRQNDGGYANFEDSLIGSFISYCDYFRPRFIILENVRDFISAQKGAMFRLSLSGLIKMGYQITFGVLQCGNYGIPQFRRRVVIMAAAPGEVLPKLPEPMHAFLSKAPDVNVNGKKIATDVRWSCGPYRALTVGDAISDLPRIENDDEREEMLYKNEPLTHYQEMMRGLCSRGEDILLDHECKCQNPVNFARICHVPPMGDWRDLPNIKLDLEDGPHMPKLIYTHRDGKNGDAKNGDFRGVCACATKKGANCNKGSKQKDTMIPWCLPHTGNRHAHWAGLFGRLVWNSYFRTVVPDPGPMGKQGRILHPEQNRILSVREYARAQGLPDTFQFCGTIAQKYSQIGNVFAPPLAKSIGYELRKCVADKTNS